MPAGNGALAMFGDTPRQLLRYGIVGVGVNLLLYAGYLAATSSGLGHKISMTIFYALGVLLSFVFNRNWSFGHRGHVSSAFLRYLATYAAGYVLNFVALWWLVDGLGLPHAWVQGVMIFVVAGFIFLTQKFWVFPNA